MEFLKPATKLDKSDDYPSVTLLLKDKQNNQENFEKVLSALQESGNVRIKSDLCVTVLYHLKVILSKRKPSFSSYDKVFRLTVNGKSESKRWFKVQKWNFISLIVQFTT